MVAEMAYFHALAAAVRREGCPFGLRALAGIERAVAVPGFALAVVGR
jgi:hypothetical protein